MVVGIIFFSLCYLNLNFYSEVCDLDLLSKLESTLGDENEKNKIFISLYLREHKKVRGGVHHPKKSR